MAQGRIEAEQPPGLPPIVYPDLRAFLRELARHGELIEFKRPVDPIVEMSAVLNEARGKAVLFQHVTGSSMAAVGNVFGNWRKVEIAIGAEGRNLLPLFVDRVRTPLAPRVVSTGPVKEHVLVGDDVDLWQLPIPKVNELDGGRFVDGGVIIARDPEYGYNLTLARLHVKSGRTSCILAQVSDMAQYMQRAEARGEPIEVAVAIGLDPALHIASQSARNQIDVDEYTIAGAIRGEPVELVRGETVDLLVPASAEIVLEGVIRPGVREPEGPFGEFPGYYTTLGENECPVIEYTAITYRSNPIFQTVYLGRPQTDPPAQESAYMTALPKAEQVYRNVTDMADISDIYFPPGGCGTYHCVVAIRKRHDDDGKRVLEAMLHGRGAVKLAIVVDDDIDIRNPHEVEWAVATRYQFDADTLTATGRSPLDPSLLKHDQPGAVKVGFDATKPVSVPYPAEVTIPADMIARVRALWAESVAGPGDERVLLW